MSSLYKRFFKKAKRLFTYELKDELFWSVYYDYEKFDKTKANPVLLERTLHKSCDVFEKHKVKYWLSRGSILGFYRDRKFLPGEVDIDIDIEGDVDIYKLLQELKEFNVFVTGFHKGHFQQFALLDRETNIILDIWHYHRKNDRLINRNLYGYFWLPVELTDNLTIIEFNGRKYPCPDPEKFCSFWFGENWRTPLKYHSDWTIDYRRDCKGFIYLGHKDIKLINYCK
jgi:hypothetical protein